MRHIVVLNCWWSLWICVGCSGQPQQIVTGGTTGTEWAETEDSITSKDSAERSVVLTQVEVDQTSKPFLLIRSHLAKIDRGIKSRQQAASEVPFFEDRIKFAPMRSETVKILRAAVIAATKGNSKLQKSNIEVLERLAKISWPRLSGLKRVRIEIKSSDQYTKTGWLIKDSDKSIYWLNDEFFLEEWSISDDEVKQIVPIDFKTEVTSFLRLLTEREKLIDEEKEFDKIREWEVKHGMGYFFRGLDPQLLKLAYASAHHGLQQETNAVFAKFLKQCPGGLSELQENFVWEHLDQAIRDLGPVGTWAFGISDEIRWRRFLRICKDLQTAYPDSKYKNRLNSLIDAITKEFSKPAPKFLARPKEQFTQEETIRYLIYQLRDLAAMQFSIPGSPEIFDSSFGGPTPADLLVAIGTPSIPYLIEAMEDEMPTRTHVFSRFSRDSKSLLRRQDIAYDCLKRITGCSFYYRYHVHSLADDTPKRRKSAIEHAKAWWKMSEGVSQTKMLRNYLKTVENNKALTDLDWAVIYNICRVDALKTLADLEGPEAVLDDLHNISQKRFSNESTLIEKLVPSNPAQRAFNNLEKNIIWTDSLYVLLEYGDRKTYQRLTELAKKNVKIKDPDDPDDKFMGTRWPELRLVPWFSGDHVSMAAKHGRNLAIPLLFEMLKSTEERGLRNERSYSTADLAMDELLKLTKIDFEYKPLAEHKDRLKVIQNARDWWEKKGRTQLAPIIAKDHPPTLKRGDLFFTPRKLKSITASISSRIDTIRRRAIAKLGTVRSYQIQRALLTALAIEEQAAERLKILRILKTHPMLWHLPALITVFVNDNDSQCRIDAARIIIGLCDKSKSGWQIRLETRDAALNAARKIVQNKKEPIEVRQVAFDFLLEWDSFPDKSLLEQLKSQPEFKR